jgi:hypothetical protein
MTQCNMTSAAAPALRHVGGDAAERQRGRGPARRRRRRRRRALRHRRHLPGRPRLSRPAGPGRRLSDIGPGPAWPGPGWLQWPQMRFKPAPMARRARCRNAAGPCRRFALSLVTRSLFELLPGHSPAADRTMAGEGPGPCPPPPLPLPSLPPPLPLTPPPPLSYSSYLIFSFLRVLSSSLAAPPLRSNGVYTRGRGEGGRREASDVREADVREGRRWREEGEGGREVCVWGE